MRKFSSLALSFLSFGLILACNLGSPPPTAPVAASAQNSRQGTPFSFDNVSLLVPQGVGSGATATTSDNVEMPPFTNPSNGPMPQHIVISLQGYPLAREARIAVFKASDFAAYSDYGNNVVSELKNLDFGSGTQIPPDLGGTFFAQAAPLSMQTGPGLRILTELMEAEVPISNDQLYYYYQGVTAHSAYFVMAVLPVSAPFLASSSTEKAVPPGGVPFPPFANPNASTSDLQAYYAAVTDKLNGDSTAITPSLQSLDSLIQSISVKP